MNEKELHKLNRAELLEILLQQSKEITELKNRLEIAEAQLKDRTIRIEKCGTLAEAALEINHIFEAADNAARQYLENIRKAENTDSIDE